MIFIRSVRLAKLDGLYAFEVLVYIGVFTNLRKKERKREWDDVISVESATERQVFATFCPPRVTSLAQQFPRQFYIEKVANLRIGEPTRSLRSDKWHACHDKRELEYIGLTVGIVYARYLQSDTRHSVEAGCLLTSDRALFLLLFCLLFLFRHSLYAFPFKKSNHYLSIMTITLLWRCSTRPQMHYCTNRHVSIELLSFLTDGLLFSESKL